MRYSVELTDTMGGEANYLWCHRSEITLPDNASNLALVRRAKAELGLSGVRCKRSDLGEIIELRPYGACVVAFISPIC